MVKSSTLSAKKEKGNTSERRSKMFCKNQFIRSYIPELQWSSRTHPFNFFVLRTSESVDWKEKILANWRKILIAQKSCNACPDCPQSSEISGRTSKAIPCLHERAKHAKKMGCHVYCKASYGILKYCCLLKR